MPGDLRVRQLLEEALNSGLGPEEVCRELLGLAGQPPAERQGCLALWRDLDACLRRARPGK